MPTGPTTTRRGPVALKIAEPEGKPIEPQTGCTGRAARVGRPFALLVGNCSCRGSYSRIRGCPHWGEELTTWEKQRESETHFVSAAQGRCISRAAPPWPRPLDHRFHEVCHKRGIHLGFQ